MKDKLRFENTCSSNPEQYDVYLNNEIVAYVRLRWGFLDVKVPNVKGSTIYTYNFSQNFKGCFEDEEERSEFLELIEKKILDYMKISKPKSSGPCEICGKEEECFKYRNKWRCKKCLDKTDCEVKTNEMKQAMGFPSEVLFEKIELAEDFKDLINKNPDVRLDEKLKTFIFNTEDSELLRLRYVIDKGIVINSVCKVDDNFLENNMFLEPETVQTKMIPSEISYHKKLKDRGEDEHLTIDLDGLNFYQLFSSYLKVQKLLEGNIKNNIMVWWSPSGKGFHIDVTLKEGIPLNENILIRSMCWDDPFRIRYSLNKYHLKVYSGVDISFDYKKGKYSKPFDIPEKINHYNTEQLVKEYQDIYENRESKWMMVEFDNDSEIDKFHEIGLELKNEFGVNYKIYRNHYRYSRWLFVVYYNTENFKDILIKLEGHGLEVKK